MKINKLISIKINQIKNRIYKYQIKYQIMTTLLIKRNNNKMQYQHKTKSYLMMILMKLKTKIYVKIKVIKTKMNSINQIL